MENMTSKLYSLRDKKTKRLLNVAYTKDGLKYTYNKVGKCLYDDKSYVEIYKRISFDDVRDNKLKTSLEKSEHYYANKALILNR
tara:strand:+ start:3143 stop:3394 length:252 start_codon:yes stop_codon:yes gene_type:complete